MNFIYSAVLLLVLFNAKKSDECDNETIVAKAGSNISLTWILPDTRSHISFSIGRQFEKRIATRLADQNCEVWDNSSMHCNVNSTDDRLIVVLHIFNVATRQSGNYTLWKKTQLLDQSSYTYKHLVVIGESQIAKAKT
ncbi:hypothetical protein ACJMK2_026200 [Sinanodonta woodiana]|uniref:Uncharacterized protein n=1 Tax=Sinanodonta woodiana TaxID=1069815 RepID=A0ABD3XIV1_SINWO